MSIKSPFNVVCGICGKKMSFSPTRALTVHKMCMKRKKRENETRPGTWTKAQILRLKAAGEL